MFARARVSPAQAILLEQRARAMRWAPTSSEHLLWQQLSGSKTGFAFRGQLVIANHIVDFACTKVRLIVEVDDGYHERRQRKDAARDADLAGLGWHVLHFREELVLADVHAVVRVIVQVAEAR
ncbi:MAG: DUF559 domain-containing protein [Polyangiaceae bacterium]|nr:DUF559 domain-containing protein [Polyangiaceae bacterium]